jgi:predicted nucleotidyltransferase
VGLEHLAEPYRDVVARLLEGLLATWGERLVSLVVFGSVARGEVRGGSDVDLLVVGASLPRPRFRRQELFEAAERFVEPLMDELRSKGFDLDFSPIILDVEEARRHRPIYLDMVLDAVIVFDRDGFFQGVLRGLAERLEALGAERRRLGKLWYWVLKMDYRPGEVIEV